ncbi:MAG: hypothetical protein JNL60_14645 [Bacteroidia bacterium]|nr:hypothetical protein [Bacteroidia bacterium]
MTEYYLKIRGGVISLIIGTPLALLALYFGLFLPASNSNEDLFLIIPLVVCSQGFLIALALVLWRTGTNASANLLKGQHVRWVFVKYSTTLGLLMGVVFSCTAIFCWSSLSYFFIISGLFLFAELFIPILLIFAGAFVVSFIIGILVCYAIKWQITRNHPNLNGPETR